MILAFDFKNILIPVAIVFGIAVVLALLLAVANQFLQVKVGERIPTVTSLLPGYNCGACGKPGCSGFAEALVNKEATSVSGCKTIKPEAKQKIVDYLTTTPGPDGSTLNVTL